MLLSPRSAPTSLPQSPAPSPLSPSPVSVLGQASGVEILGGTITSAGANVITIHNGSTSPPPVGPSSSQQSAEPPRSNVSGPSNTLIRSSTVQSPLHESQVYAKYLLPKKHGYPLWIPQPPNDLPPEYTQIGISIGDVGIITPDGAFDFLFNVLLPADDPINGGYVPDDFVPLRFGARDIRVNEPAWDENTCVSSHYIQNQKVFSDDTCAAYIFTCTASNGAILTLPKGAVRQDLRNMNALAAYAMKNSLSWYQYMNEVRGWEAPNGSLYIITGCDKTSLWGNASFSNAAMARSFDLRFKIANTRPPVSPTEASRSYFWEQTIFASTKSTPRRAPTGPTNQCVFLRGFQIRVRENALAALISKVTVTDVSTVKPASVLSRSKFIPFGNFGKSSMLSLGRLSPTGKGSTRHERAASDATTRSGWSVGKPASEGYEGIDATLVRNFSSYGEQFHPSDIINAYLLDNNTDAKVAITHDNVWMTLINEGERLVPAPDELIRRLHTYYEVVCKDDSVSVTRRSKPLVTDATPLAIQTQALPPMSELASTKSGELQQGPYKEVMQDWATWQPDPVGNSWNNSSTAKEQPAPELPPASVPQFGLPMRTWQTGWQPDPSEAPSLPPPPAPDISGKLSNTSSPKARETYGKPLSDVNFERSRSTVERKTLHQLVGILEKEEGSMNGDWKTPNGRTLLSILAERGRRAAVQRLLSSGNIQPDETDSVGRSPLSYAAEMGHPSVVTLLLEKGADVNLKDPNGRTPLSFAASRGQAEAIKILLQQPKADVDMRDSKQRTPLSYAAEHGHVEALNCLLRCGADLNAEDAEQRTPFSYAAQEGQDQTIWSLMSRPGLKFEAADCDNRTPMFHAAINGHLATFETILRKAPLSSPPIAGLNQALTIVTTSPRLSSTPLVVKDRLGRDMISYVAERGHGEVLHYLVQRGVNVNSSSAEGRTPLSFAAGGGDMEVVTSLLAQPRIVVDFGDRNRMTPLAHAAARGHPDIISLLLKKGAQINSRDTNERTPLSIAAEYGHIGVVNRLLASRTVLADLMDNRLRTPLSYAAEKGHVEVLRVLLEKRVDLNFCSVEGRTALSFAAGNGQLGTVRLLLKHPFILADAVDHELKTSLFHAAQNGHIAVVKELVGMDIRANADSPDNHILALVTRSRKVDSTLSGPQHSRTHNSLFSMWMDIYGRTPLSYAVEYGHRDIFDFFLERNFDPALPDKRGRTPLSYAAEKGRIELVERLVKFNTQVINLRDEHGRTPLSYAAENGHDEIVATLLQNRAAPNTRDLTGRTPLSFAAERGCLSIVWSLLGRRDVQVDAADDQIRTPLSYACEHGQMEVVSRLLEMGKADVNTEDKNGRTPLSYAAENGHAAAVYKLLERDDITNSPDKSGKSPLSYAKENGHIAVLKAFLEKVVASQEPAKITRPMESVKRIGPPPSSNKKRKDVTMLQRQVGEIRKEMLALGTCTDSSLSEEDAADRQRVADMLSFIDPRPKSFFKRIPHEFGRYKNKIRGLGRRQWGLAQ